MMTTAGSVALATFLLSATPDPIEKAGALHFLGAASLGACVRWTTAVAGSGPCGEVGAALDWRFASTWLLNAELGVGFMNSTSVIDGEIIRTSGRAAYLGARVMIGHDFYPTFFLRLGAQTRWTFAVNTAGVQAVGDIGTRIGRHVEFGVRPYVGVDGVGSNATPRFTTALAMGAALLVRVTFL